MTDEFVECFNCGRANPEWAQVCRTCGVPLRHAAAAEVPSGPIPRDRDSLVSIGAVLGIILLAALIGIFVAGLNPTEPTVGQNIPTPTPSPTPEPSPSEPAPTETPIPTPTGTPGPIGTITFGAGLNENDEIVEPTDTFSPGMDFAHRIDMPEPWGVSNIAEGIFRINDDGTEAEVVRAIDNQPQVVPDLTYAAFSVAVTPLYEEWGPGTYEMRVFRGASLVAQGRFVFVEG